MTRFEEERAAYLHTRDEMRDLSLAAHLQLNADLGSWGLQQKFTADENIVDFADELSHLGVLTPDHYYNKDFYREQLHFLHRNYRWAKYGYNVFQLTHSLAAALILTEPPPLKEGWQDEEVLKLPYPSFVITLPPEIIPVFIEEETPPQKWADSLWVYSFKSLYRVTNDIQPFLRWSVAWKTVNVWRDRHPNNLLINDGSFYNLSQYLDPKPLPEDEATMETALRLVRNLLLWLDATNALAAPPTKPWRTHKRKKLRAGKKVNPITTWVLGREVKLQPELRRMASEVALGHTSSQVEGWKLRYKHIVRGHWKMQPYGPQHSLRKHIFIEPYWKGPEGTEAWSHIYK